MMRSASSLTCQVDPVNPTSTRASACGIRTIGTSSSCFSLPFSWGRARMPNLRCGSFRTLAILLCLAGTSLVSLAQAPLPATAVPEQRLTPEWRAERHAEKVAQAKTGKAQLVMIGDSITHNWERQRNYAEQFSRYNTLNLGFGGDRTQNVLWRIQNGGIDGISPKLVTLMIGTNNINRNKPDEIAAGINTIVAELRQRLPESRIVVLSIFPRKHSRGNGEDFKAVEEVNKLLPALADNQHVFHVDINQAFLGDNGQPRKELYSRDLLHLSNQGYAAWSAALKPLLAEAGLTPAEGDSVAESATEPPVIRLWPIDRVGGEANRLKEIYRDRRGRKQLCGVLDPNMTVYQVKSDAPTPALIYCPGGAYKILGLPSPQAIKAWHELGISVFVLKYTIPDAPDAAFKDVQRAVRIVRHQAKKWNVDPKRIGLFGNSAGGHLSARLTQNYEHAAYEPIDEADTVSCEPNFATLQCAAYFQGREMDKDFDAELFHMKNKTAPTFLTYSKDDKFCKGGIDYAKQLTDAGGKIELKLFAKGGHGMAGCDWFTPMSQWLKKQQIVK